MIILEALIGFCAGAIISAGIFAFITTIGIITRIAKKTHTEKLIQVYEDFITLGATAGNIIIIANPAIRLGNLGTACFGFFSGIFVGCLIMSLAETISALPVMVRNIKLKVGIPYIILAMALGKMVGAFVFFITN
ncbi:hypothetical protein P261_01215 [Lachnospiraceae bacterium TWA4]|nr:hypothetical protein P261_01215 [Lachnospiraceae bacterium TWA4]